MADAQYTNLINTDESTPYFGQMMLRDVMLPQLLGQSTPDIMYFAGRDLATKLPVGDEGIPDLFTAMGLGTLQIGKVKTKLRNYSLSGTPVETRIKNFTDADFQFEAGLLAQLIQQALGMTTEAISKLDRHAKTVEFTVSIDPNEEQTIISATRRDRD